MSDFQSDHQLRNSTAPNVGPAQSAIGTSSSSPSAGRVGSHDREPTRPSRVSSRNGTMGAGCPTGIHVQIIPPRACGSEKSLRTWAETFARLTPFMAHAIIAANRSTSGDFFGVVRIEQAFKATVGRRARGARSFGFANSVLSRLEFGTRRCTNADGDAATRQLCTDDGEPCIW